MPKLRITIEFGDFAENGTCQKVCYDSDTQKLSFNGGSLLPHQFAIISDVQAAARRFEDKYPPEKKPEPIEAPRLS